MTDTNDYVIEENNVLSSPVTNVRLTGQVKWFNTKAGYGFITVSDDGPLNKKDVFVHFSSIKVVNSQYKYLVQGEYVEFDVESLENGKYEFHAVNISGIRNGTLMCETRRVVDSAPPVLRRSNTSYVDRGISRFNEMIRDGDDRSSYRRSSGDRDDYVPRPRYNSNRSIPEDNEEGFTVVRNGRNKKQAFQSPRPIAQRRNVASSVY